MLRTLLLLCLVLQWMLWGCGWLAEAQEEAEGELADSIFFKD
jgi:hypothetical protein